MKNRSSYAVLTRFGIIAAILATLVLIAPAATAQSECEVDGNVVKCTYPENGTDPVLTLGATDADGDDIEWGLDGDDAGDFAISDDGVLTFKDKPSFETPKDDNIDNTYKVTVTANNGEQAVEVKVTDVDEPGKVTFSGTGKYQPQVGRNLRAEGPGDQDVPISGITWQWSRGESAEGPWTDIPKATSPGRTPTGDDLNMYLRATVTYTDLHDSGKMASGVTARAVELRTTANAAPVFTDEDDATEGIQVARAVDEGVKSANVGDPITAKDGDGDELVYTIDPASADYAINEVTGQVTTKTKRDSDDDGDDATNVTETFTVKVTDPSGASGEATVTVTINDVNDNPAFSTAADDLEKELWLTEGTDPPALYTDATAATTLPADSYVADDADAGDGTSGTDADIKYAVEGADGGSFAISAAGVLTVKGTHTPNYESKSSYSITVVARDDETPIPGEVSVAVKVNVRNANDDGKVTFSAREPQRGKSIVATLTDEDGSIRGPEWQWYRNAASDTAESALSDLDPDTEGDRCTNDGVTLCLIHGATSPQYTPGAADLDTFNADGTLNLNKGLLAARVTYSDACVRGVDDTPPFCDGLATDETDLEDSMFMVTTRDVQEEDPGNTAPVWDPDQDPNTPGNQAAAERSVVENKKNENVGEPVNVDDSDLVMFSLGGPDADSFKLVDPTGESNSVQIQTKVELDYETRDSYTVVVTATDPSGASGSLTVNITVLDGPDKAVVTPAASECDLDGSTLKCTYAENGEDPVATFEATDEDADNEDFDWGLSGDDAGDFKISDDGVLTFKDKPSFETPKDDNVDNTYKVKVTANNGEHPVEVEVTDVDEPGKVTFSGTGEYQPQVGRGLVANGPGDEDVPISDISWQWSRGESAEGPWTDIPKATSNDREPTGDDLNMYLRATVTYKDKHSGDETVSASGVTARAVEPKTTANAAPVFTDETDADVDDVPDTGGDQNLVVVLRAVDEGVKSANAGDPVTAKDGDGDELIYTIEPDNANYAINEVTGQVTTKTKRDSDDDGLTGDDDASGEIVETFTVRATDPSGAFGEATVKVTITDVNDNPAFNEGDDVVKELWVTDGVQGDQLRKGSAEGADDLAEADYEADDDDAGDDHNVNTPTGTPPVVALKYAVEGADKGSFTINTETGVLDLKSDHTPNYEAKSSYSITVVVRDNEVPVAGEATVAVKVNVVNAEDNGKISLSVREPQVGKSIVATLTDGDGTIRGPEWQWYRNAASGTGDSDLDTADGAAVCEDDTTTLCRIGGATSPQYVPVKADVQDGDADLLAARVTYQDACVRGTAETPPVCDGLTGTETDEVDSMFMVTTRDVQEEDPGNTAPEWDPDQDPNTPGNQAEAERSVVENKKNENVGEPVNVEDSDLVMFSLGGPDAESFKLVDPTGESNSVQIQTKVELNYEALPEDDKYLTVIVTATDPSGASSNLTVNIEVLDGPDNAVISLVRTDNAAPAFEGATASRSVDENMPAGTNVGDAVAATDEDDDTVTYSLSGSDYFEIDSATGQISTTMMLDYEAMGRHTVTVMADDGSGVENATASIAVTVNVGNVEECEDTGAMAVADTSNAGAMADCEALLASRDALMGDDATRMLNWSKDTPMADWYGVRRLTASGRVEWLYLHGVSAKDATGDAPARAEVKLNGTMPAELGGLTEMTRLYLHRNNLTGGIPAELNGLTSLVWLRLYDNDLSGEVPDLSDMASLERFYVHENQLTGGVPTALSDSVTHIRVDRNMLTGEIPDLSGMTNLVWLGLYDNDLSGEIPATVGSIANLKRLYLHGNALMGAVPMEIGNLASLTNLWLTNNMLSGELPSSLDNLTNLERVRISGGNSFTGCIPAALANAANTDAADTGLATCGAGGQ